MLNESAMKMWNMLGLWKAFHSSNHLWNGLNLKKNLEQSILGEESNEMKIEWAKKNEKNDLGYRLTERKDTFIIRKEKLKYCIGMMNGREI